MTRTAPTRRTVALGLAALSLVACSGTPAPSVPTRTAFRPAPNPAFDAWVAAFKTRAAARGITQTTIDRAFRNVGFLPDVIERDRNQTEFKRSLEDYLAIAASDERISKGRAALRRHANTLAQIEARYGVPANVVTAVWGLESFYGERRGDVPVMSALSTLAFDGRRGAFFEAQLMSALRILERGDTTPEKMTGSWAGAMGHTQFMPESFERLAVDFTGDGRRDIWADDPTDSLASTANYLARSGWQTGRPWGVEVRLPQGFDTSVTGRGKNRSPAAWADLGIRDMRGNRVPDHGPASILIPMGPAAPAFMVFRNFTAISRYNNAINYVIGVGHLSDRLVGDPPIQGSYPPDATGMTIDDRRALQRRLTAKGYDTGGVDGVIGDNTRDAIRAYQADQGIAVTGEPSLSLLAMLR